MKKFYSFMATAMMGALSFTASAQTEDDYTILQDLTSKIQNADFSADEAVTAKICTYAYDIPEEDGGLAAGGVYMYGQQNVTGWTNVYPSDNKWVPKADVDGGLSPNNARAAGIFAYIEGDPYDVMETPTAQLGGDFYAPYTQDYCTTMTGGKCLGMVAVWGSTVQYTQEVTLPAGAYMLVMPVANVAGTGTLTKKLNGFIAADGTEYLTKKAEYTVGVQENDVIAFRLTEETTGVISVGFQVTGVGSASAPHIFVDGVQLYSIDPTPLMKEEIDKAKETLLAVIEEGEQLGASTDAAQDVYDDDDATMEQVLAAIESQKSINEASKVDLSEFFITNPHFNIDNPLPDGEGICTYDYDMEKQNPPVHYYGMQPVSNWVASSPNENARACGVYAIGSNTFLGGAGYLPPTVMSDGSDSGNLLGFISVWSATTQYTQAVTIPAGKYTFSVSYYNAGGTGSIGKNLMGFISEDGEEYLCEVKSFKEKEWNKMSVFFELDEPTAGHFSVGFQAANAGSDSMPHLFIDGINLNYVGEINFDPSLLALQVTVNTAQDLLSENFNNDLYDQLKEAIENGAKLVSSQSNDEEANKAAAEAINSLVPAIKANIAAYESLQKFFNDVLMVAYEQYENIENIHERLNAMVDEAEEVLDSYEWTTEQIDAFMASLTPALNEELQKAWDAAVASGAQLEDDLPLTSLFEQMAYTNSSTAQSGSNVPDKEWNYGNAGNFKTQYGTAEVWNQSPFTVQRTLKDMPRGTYTVTTRAFYRMADNAVNYDNYLDDKTPKAFVFAGHNRTGIANVAELAVEQEGQEGYTSVDAYSVYVPNNQKAGYNVFNNEDYASVVTVSASTALAETGDLTFGVCADQLEGNSWVLWYSFELTYNAFDQDIYNANFKSELETLIAQAELLTDSEGVIYSEKAGELLDQALVSGSSALEGTIAEMEAASATLREAIAYVNEATTLFNKVGETFQKYYDMYSELDDLSSSVDYQSLLDEADGITASGAESNEKMQEIIDALINQWPLYILSQDGMASATADEPCNVTPVIKNASFETNGTAEWTYTASEEDTRMAQNQNAKGSVGDITNGAEAWDPTVIKNGIFGQEIAVALPAGFYTLDVDGFAIKQKHEEGEDEISGVYLMAKSELGTQTVSICSNETDGASAVGHYSITFESDGKSLVTVGVQVYNTNANWFVVDNFQLNYIGKTAPDAIGATVANAQPAAIYTVGGVKANKLVKGINIVKNSDGTVTKVLK